VPSHDIADAGLGEAELLTCVPGVAVQPEIVIIVIETAALTYDALMFLLS
jgi:hypothetical protein